MAYPRPPIHPGARRWGGTPPPHWASARILATAAARLSGATRGKKVAPCYQLNKYGFPSGHLLLRRQRAPPHKSTLFLPPYPPAGTAIGHDFSMYAFPPRIRE